MAAGNLYTEFASEYSKARMFIKQNSPSDARKSIIECMKILAELYKTCTTVKERANIYAHVCD